mmetsp:Transcript_36273/g.91330  ORF Transcript_36273/g.91330 Transcript_36273/m.91330 type:complete len:236 (-) Transcript_36273:1205-1912(-)
MSHISHSSCLHFLQARQRAQPQAKWGEPTRLCAVLKIYTQPAPLAPRNNSARFTARALSCHNVTSLVRIHRKLLRNLRRIPSDLNPSARNIAIDLWDHIVTPVAVLASVPAHLDRLVDVACTRCPAILRLEAASSHQSAEPGAMYTAHIQAKLRSIACVLSSEGDATSSTDGSSQRACVLRPRTLGIVSPRAERARLSAPSCHMRCPGHWHARIGKGTPQRSYTSRHNTLVIHGL